MPNALWVAQLIISDRVSAKITSKHNIDAFDVRQAIVAVPGLRYRFRADPPRRPRYYVEFWVGSDRALAALYPVEHPLGDVYALGSAYREPRGLDTVTEDLPEVDEAAESSQTSEAAGDESERQNVNVNDDQLL